MQNTTLCYIERNDAYLMLHRVKKVGDLNKDKWIGIGGHIEENESPEDCILREAREETGLILEKPAYRGVVTFVSDRYEGEFMHLFTAERFSGEMKACDEGNLEWVGKSELGKLNLWEGDLILFDLLERKVPFFSLKLVYEGDRLKEAILNQEKIR